MQTQQVLGVAGGGMLFTAKSNSSKASDNSFDQLIQMSQNAGAVNEQTAKPAETKAEAAADVTKAEQPEQTADVSTESKDTTAAAEEQPELGKAEVTEEATDVEAAERVAGVLNQIMEVIKEVLGLSEEELNGFMEQLGITGPELMQPETLQNLVLMANSEQDAVVLLTDDKLLTTVNELINHVEELLQEAGVTPEELVSALDNPDFEALVEEVLVKLNAEPDGQEEVAGEEKESTTVESLAPVETKEAEPTVTTELHTEDRETETSENKQNTDDSTKVDNIAEQFVQNLTKAAEEISEVT